MFYHLHLGARLFLFGSSKNGFGFRNSDIDICMTLDDMAKEEVKNSVYSCFVVGRLISS